MTIDELSVAVYEDLNGRILSVSMGDESYQLRFGCDDWRIDGHERRCFELQFIDVIEATATPTYVDDLHVFDEHPLLWEYNDPSASMYFYHRMTTDPFALLGRLHEAHVRLLEGWRELSRYWKADSKLLLGGYGCLAQGPQRVIEEYSRILHDVLPHSIVSTHRPGGGLRVVLFDEEYVICRNVSVTEL